MNQQIADLTAAFNDETNVLAAKLDALIAGGADDVTPEQIAGLQAISDRLKALGADPAQPIPADQVPPTA